MPDQIRLDPDVSSSSVILVGGTCYRYAGPSSDAPDTFSIDDEFDDCVTCNSVPCTCPSSGLQSSYTIHFPAGTYSFGDGTIYTWNAQDIQVTGGGNNNCTWQNPTGAFVWTDQDGNTYQSVSIVLEHNDAGPAFAACNWDILVFNRSWEFYYVSTVGATPDYGEYLAYGHVGGDTPVPGYGITVSTP